MRFGRQFERHTCTTAVHACTGANVVGRRRTARHGSTDAPDRPPGPPALPPIPRSLGRRHPLREVGRGQLRVRERGDGQAHHLGAQAQRHQEIVEHHALAVGGDVHLCGSGAAGRRSSAARDQPGQAEAG